MEKSVGLLATIGSHTPCSWWAFLLPSSHDPLGIWDPHTPYHLPHATLGPVGYGGGLHASMGAGVPGAVGVPGQDAVVARVVVGAAGQW